MLNQHQLIGRLGHDPELRYTPAGQAVCNFSLAVNEVRMKDGERQETTEWFKVVIFGKQAENCQKYLGKGSLVYVSGPLCVRKYEKRDGGEGTAVETVAVLVKFIGPKKDAVEGRSLNGSATSEPQVTDEDIPF